MPLSEQEEFELLSLERERAMGEQEPPQGAAGFVEKANQIAGSMPQNVIARKAKEGLDTANKAIEGVAYRAGGGVTDIASGYMPPEVAAALGFATNVGIQAVPSFLGGMGGKSASGLMERGARRSMKSAVKPSSAIPQPKVERAIHTMLDEGINATYDDLLKVGKNIEDAEGVLTKIIANSQANVDVNQAASRALDVLRRAKNQVNPNTDVRTVLNSIDEFLNHPAVNQYAGGQIPIQTAQALKRGTYQALGNKAYGEVDSVSNETQKSLARGLREEMSAAEPATAPINERMSKLLNVQEVLAPRVAVEGNKNLVGLGAISPSHTGFLGWLLDRSPLVKSWLARGMYSGRERIPEAAGAALGVPAGTYMGRPVDEAERP